MTTIKLLAAASLMLLLAPASQALASVPRDVGSFQTQCMAQGGEFGLGDAADSYDCGYLDGNIQTCDFGGNKPTCVIISGPPRHHQDTADNGNGPHQPVSTPKVCHVGSPLCP